MMQKKQTKWESVLLFLSFAAEAVLIARPHIGNIVFSLVIGLAVAGWMRGRKEKALKGPVILLPLALQGIITGNAVLNWSRMLAGTNEAFQVKDITDHLFILPFILAGGILGFFFLIRLFGVLLELRDLDCSSHERSGVWENNSPNCRYILLGISFLCSLVLVTVCSESSFLYPLNDWEDVNCFMTVGKEMMNGLLPYRDLLEHKGPFLYFLYGIASLISSTSFLGGYLLEILSGTAFLYYIGKTIRLYCPENEKTVLWLIPLFAIFVYTSHAFFKGGSTEEFCLPLFAYTLYTGLRALRTEEPVCAGTWLVTGISVGLVLWLKYSMLGFYAGWFLFFACSFLRNKRYAEFGRMLLWFVCGVLLTTLPVALYFGANHALKDLWEVYFYDNIFLYPGVKEGSTIVRLAQHYLRGCILIVNKNTVAFLLVILFLILGKRKKEILFILIPAAFLFLTSFIGQWTWAYYTLAFSPLACIGLCKAVERIRPEMNIRPAWFTAILLCLPLSVFLTPNLDTIGTPREETVQYKFAKMMDPDENTTMLNYKFLDGGFYHAAGIRPNCKAFCTLAVSIPEMYELQNRYVREGLCDYIISRGPVDDPQYEQIAKEKVYFLFRRK